MQLPHTVHVHRIDSVLRFFDVNSVLCVVVLNSVSSCSWSWFWSDERTESKQMEKSDVTHWYRTEVVAYFCCIDRCMIIVRPTNRKRVRARTIPGSLWVRSCAVSHNKLALTSASNTTCNGKNVSGKNFFVTLLVPNASEKKCIHKRTLGLDDNNKCTSRFVLAIKLMVIFTPEINQSWVFFARKCWIWFGMDSEKKSLTMEKKKIEFKLFPPSSFVDCSKTSC